MAGDTASARQYTQNSGGNNPAGVQQNSSARSLILARSVNMIQNVYSTTITSPGSTNNVINAIPRFVGLNKRFYVEISATVSNSDSTYSAALTPLGAANLLSQVTFTDLSNNVRVQTAGWHLFLLSSAKRFGAFGAAYTNDSPVSFGSNWAAISAPSTIAASGTGTIKITYEVPLSYSDTDLRGAIWMNVINATAQLQLVLNPAISVLHTADPTLAVYQMATSGTGAVTITSATVNVYQNYLDQLPVAQNGAVVLPITDLSTVYLIQNTTNPTTLSANSDNPVPYANYRDFLSTFAIFDNGGTLNTGSDVNYWAIQAANYVNYVKYDPNLAAIFSRNTFSSDLPAGVYYFSHRHKPISTQQFGNTQLILNPSTVNTGGKLLLGYEMFALINLIAQAGALSVA